MVDAIPKLGASLSHQLYLLLRDGILRGQIAADEQLPSEKTLAERHGVSRVTVRRALERLDEEGLVRRVHGVGTFVAPQARPSVLIGKLEGFVEQADWLTHHTDVTLIELECLVPAGGIAAAMGLEEGEEAQRSLRLRRYRGKPCLLLETFVPGWLAAQLPTDELERGSVQNALKVAGVELAEVDYTVSASPADLRLSELLEVPVATALMSMVWLFRDRTGRVVEYQFAHARPDVYVLRTSLRPPT
ncbi:MAG: GntR family transcriptional regulator [Acuticoccus sp.]